jgi:GTPase SAR1 family protein
VRVKRRKIEAIRTAAATKGDIDEGKAEFIHEVEESVSKGETVDRKLANCMLVGPNGSGKSSLMIRLLKRPRKEFSPSTGVCDHLAIVDIDVPNPSTFHSVTVTDPNTWKEVEYDISLVRQMNKLSAVTSPREQVQPELSEETTNVPIEMTSLPTLSTANSVPESAQLPEPLLEHARQTEAVTAKPATASALTKIIFENGMREVIMAVIDKCGGFECFRKSFKGASLYMRDTGGQVEFQEMISLLIFGPSIFLFVFRADLDFQSKFSIEYRVGEGESTNCYTSSITTEEAFLQCLASVYAMDTSGKAGVKTHKPLVLIIGTHKDRLGPSAEEKIAKLNEHLDSLIKKRGFEDLVQYANAGKDEVMFTVDNMSESDEDFKPIRAKVHSLISGREEFTIEYLITYLLFCLELQKLKCSVLSLEEFRAMAARYGIVGDQVSHLLQFLHLRIGVIQYYDVDGLRHIVVKEPQVLFNKVTNLIIRTFSCEALTTSELRNFQKGILTASVLKSVVSSEDGITSQDFLKLLVHLRIITPYPSTVPGDQEERFFIPCVLNHVPESTEEDFHTDMLPLSVGFKCSHCPKGLFGVLVTHLMTPVSAEEPDSSHTSFRLIENKIFKDQVSFEAQFHSDHDKVTLKVFSSHLEVSFSPSLSDERDTSLGEASSNIREVIETSILRSLEDLHYSRDNVKPAMCFRCDHCSKLHPVEKMRGKNYHRMYCSKAHTNSPIPPEGRCWFNEGQCDVLGCHLLL